jgi:excisionase family DNA binding protein
MKDAMSKSLSVRQAAGQLGYTQKYIRDLLYERKLAGAYKKKCVWRIPASAVEKWLNLREARNAK